MNIKDVKKSERIAKFTKDVHVPDLNYSQHANWPDWGNDNLWQHIQHGSQQVVSHNFPKGSKKKKDLHDTRRLANQLGVSCQWLIYSTSNMCIIFCFAIGCLVGGGEKEKKKDGTSSLHETGSKDWNIGVILYLSGILIIKKMIRFCMNLNYTYLKRK